MYLLKKTCYLFHLLIWTRASTLLQILKSHSKFKLVNLNPAKASGPEGWAILSLKECVCELSIPLSILFVKSLDSLILPIQWKEACVTPTFKKSDHHCVNNYRPISLTFPVVKILESIIKDQIQVHLNSYNQLYRQDDVSQPLKVFGETNY